MVPFHVYLYTFINSLHLTARQVDTLLTADVYTMFFEREKLCKQYNYNLSCRISDVKFQKLSYCLFATVYQVKFLAFLILEKSFLLFSIIALRSSYACSGRDPAFTDTPRPKTTANLVVFPFYEYVLRCP